MHLLAVVYDPNPSGFDIPGCLLTPFGVAGWRTQPFFLVADINAFLNQRQLVCCQAIETLLSLPLLFRRLASCLPLY